MYFSLTALLLTVKSYTKFTTVNNKVNIKVQAICDRAAVHNTGLISALKTLLSLHVMCLCIQLVHSL